MKNRKISIGVLSCANIADRHVIPAIIELDDIFFLKGIAGRDPEKTRASADKFKTVPYDGYASLLETGELDAVYIPLPNSLHAEWIEKAFEKNIHVLVEKSLACTLADVERLNDLARSKNLVLVENFQFRFHNQLNIIKQLLKEGAIGELRCLRSSFGFPPFPDPENIRYKKELGGGALLDAGAYCVKAAQLFLGYDLTVSASSLFIDNDRGIDIWGGAYLSQDSGAMFAEAAFGFDNFYQCSLELWGNKGKITANRIFTAPPGFQPEIIVENSKGRETMQLKPDHHFKNMLTHFYNLITTRLGLEEEYEQNFHQARLIEELKVKANAG